MGAVTAYQYDDAGRLVALFPGMMSQRSTSMTTILYGCLAWGETVWKYERNEQGDVTRRTDPDGEATDYSYN